MTVTEQYTTMQSAFQNAAASAGCSAFDVRVLVALDDHDGAATTDVLAVALAHEGSMIRRSCVALRELGLVHATAIDGYRTRPGVRSRLDLTDAGHKVVVHFRRLANPMRAAA